MYVIGIRYFTGGSNWNFKCCKYHGGKRKQSSADSDLKFIFPMNTEHCRILIYSTYTIMFHWLHLNTRKTELAGLTKVTLDVPSSWPLFKWVVLWKYGFSLVRLRRKRLRFRLKSEKTSWQKKQVIVKLFFKEVFSTLFLYRDFNQGMSSLSNNQDIPYRVQWWCMQRTHWGWWIVEKGRNLGSLPVSGEDAGCSD